MLRCEMASTGEVGISEIHYPVLFSGLFLSVRVNSSEEE